MLHTDRRMDSQPENMSWPLDVKKKKKKAFKLALKKGIKSLGNAELVGGENESLRTERQSMSSG